MRRMTFTFGGGHTKFKPRKGDLWWCNLCKRWLKKTDFHKSPKPCGIRSWCKDCVRVTGKAYHDKKRRIKSDTPSETKSEKACRERSAE